MKRPRRKSDGETVSLFPFLAVLISTMGALLVLLVVIARQVQADARKETSVATESQMQSQAELEKKRAAIDAKVAELIAMRNKANERLSERREALSHLEDHMRRMRDQLRQLRDAAQQRKNLGERQSHDMKQREAEVARVAQQLAESEKLLADAKRDQTELPVAHAIVPYIGLNGTHRQPIYIECLGERIVIQPEGIELTERDFAEPLGPGNPLASLLRAHSQYVRNERPEARPYPLLVVRPSGIGAYYAARAAMQSWESEFGYELVGEEWDLEFPTADPKLAHILYESVELARRRHQILVRQERERQRRESQQRPKLNQSRPGHPGFGRLVENPQAGGGLLSSQANDDGHGTGSGSGTGSGPGTGAPPRPFALPSSGTESDRPHATPSPGLATSSSTSGSPSPGRSSGSPAGGTQASNAAGASPGGAEAEPSTPQGEALQPMAETRGSNWALPGASRGSVPILRPVRVLCSDQQLTIVPRNRQSTPIVIPIEGKTRNAMEAFVSNVWKHMKTWGVAGQGLYWKPTVNLYVQPGGAARAAELSALLKDSGLEVNHAK